MSKPKRPQIERVSTLGGVKAQPRASRSIDVPGFRQRELAALPGRTEKPLHVMLDERDLERYKALARERGMTLRDLVRESLESTWNYYQVQLDKAQPQLGANNIDGVGPPLPVVTREEQLALDLGVAAHHVGGASVKGLERRLLQLTERVSRIENQLAEATGGAFTAMVVKRAHELAEQLGDGSDEDWQAKRTGYLTAAFEEIASYYPEPTRSELRATKPIFLARAFKPRD